MMRVWFSRPYGTLFRVPDRYPALKRRATIHGPSRTYFPDQTDLRDCSEQTSASP